MFRLKSFDNGFSGKHPKSSMNRSIKHSRRHMLRALFGRGVKHTKPQGTFIQRKTSRFLHRKYN